MFNVLKKEQKPLVLNVCLSSTWNWNPGDDWIRIGIVRLLEELASRHGCRLNFIHYNRSPDNMQNRRMSSRLEPDLMGNYFCKNDFRGAELIDLFVACGSPEWRSFPHEDFHSMIVNSTAPYWLVGIGTTDRNVNLTPLDKTVFLRENTRIITRSIDASIDLNKVLKQFKSDYLPCPAVFSTMTSPKKTEGTAYVVQAPYGAQRQLESLLVGMKPEYPVIAERIEEWEYFSDLGFEVYYNPDPQAILDTIGKFETIITTRLHGAIAALATGSKVNLVSNKEFRIMSAAHLFGIPIYSNVRDAHLGRFTTYIAPKWDTWNKYLIKLNQEFIKVIERKRTT